jgi:beta-lactamase class A
MKPFSRFAAATLLVLSTATTFAQHQQLDMRAELRNKLEAELKTIDEQFDGVFGVQFVDLTDGTKISINADGTFPTASAIKVPVLLELLRQADAKPGLLKEQRPFAANGQTQNSGMARLLGAGSMIAVEDIAKMMINLSENNATNILIDEVGMENVNRFIASIGLTKMRLQRKMLASDLQAASQDNLSSPADAATLMTRLHRCDLPISKAACDRARQILEIPQDSHPAKDGIPRNIPIAFKWGGNEGVSTGWAIVNLPDRPYVFAIMTTFGLDNAKAVRAASDAGFKYFSQLARANNYGGRVNIEVMRKEREKSKPQP